MKVFGYLAVLLLPLAAMAEDRGLAVGNKAPAFSLKAQDGNEIALSDLLKKGPVAVVFHRSADW